MFTITHVCKDGDIYQLFGTLNGRKNEVCCRNVFGVVDLYHNLPRTTREEFFKEDQEQA